MGETKKIGIFVAILVTLSSRDWGRERAHKIHVQLILQSRMCKSLGRQIRFFIESKDEEKFVNYLVSQNYYFVDKYNQHNDVSELLRSNVLSFFIASPQSKIHLGKGEFVDSITSDVIQYSRGFIKESHLHYGRLWFEGKYYNEYNVLTFKDDWLHDNYMNICKWVKKNFRLSNSKDFYIGEGAYELYKNGVYKMMASPKYTVDFN